MAPQIVDAVTLGSICILFAIGLSLSWGILNVVKAGRDIAARGLMVEQNASAAFGVAARAYVLEQGEVVLHGSAADVADDPRVMQTFLGVDMDEPGSQPPEVATEMAESR